MILGGVLAYNDPTTIAPVRDNSPDLRALVFYFKDNTTLLDTSPHAGSKTGLYPSEAPKPLPTSRLFTTSSENTVWGRPWSHAWRLFMDSHFSRKRYLFGSCMLLKSSYCKFPGCKRAFSSSWKDASLSSKALPNPGRTVAGVVPVMTGVAWQCGWALAGPKNHSWNDNKRDQTQQKAKHQEPVRVRCLQFLG